MLHNLEKASEPDTVVADYEILYYLEKASEHGTAVANYEMLYNLTQDTI